MSFTVLIHHMGAFRFEPHVHYAGDLVEVHACHGNDIDMWSYFECRTLVKSLGYTANFKIWWRTNEDAAENLYRELLTDDDAMVLASYAIHNKCEVSLFVEHIVEVVDPIEMLPDVEDHIVEEPFHENPIAEEPIAEEPIAEEPIAEEPIAEEPIAEEPIAEEPIVEEPNPTGKRKRKSSPTKKSPRKKFPRKKTPSASKAVGASAPPEAAAVTPSVKNPHFKPPTKKSAQRRSARMRAVVHQTKNNKGKAIVVELSSDEDGVVEDTHATEVPEDVELDEVVSIPGNHGDHDDSDTDNSVAGIQLNDSEEERNAEGDGFENGLKIRGRIFFKGGRLK
ncbi:uncharacterized protein LOC130726100 isoform X2 [Lotus japonicus]|nr:uncharacterized protein LOC130726100 isoform X2 [Lotus japonicus]